jgi:hypothetical protein
VTCEVAVVDRRNKVTIDGCGSVTVQAVPAGAPLDENLRLDQVLSGSTLRRVQDGLATNTQLYLAADGTKVDGTVTVDAVQFDTAAGVAVGSGQLAWNDTDKTLDMGIGNPTLQLGQETMLRVHNATGVEIANGAVVSVSGVTSGRLNGILSDATVRSQARGVVGLATEAIPNGQEGMITTEGLVRGINTAAYSPGDPLFLHATVPGTLQGAPPPAPPTSAVFVGVVVVAATDGVIWVSVSAPPQLTELVDVDVSTPATGEVLVYNNATSVFENKVPSYTYENVLSTYIDKPARGKVINQHGGLDLILAGGSVANGSPQAVNNGLSKMMLVVNAGIDVVGGVTITGTSVDRNTRVETPSDTEVVAINGLTTDGTDTDVQGNTRWAFTNAYMSSKWWKNGCTLSTSDCDISDLDVYAIAFEQFGDKENVVLNTVDLTMLPTNGLAWFYGYLYLVAVTGSTCTVTREGTAELPASDVTADRRYRIRRGELGLAIDGTTDGVWSELHFGPFNQTYWEDINTKLWSRITEPLVLT